MLQSKNLGKTKMVALRAPVDLYVKLSSLAHREEKSINMVILEAITLYLEKVKEELK